MEEHWPMRVVVTGDLFRDLAKKDTAVANRMRTVMEQGGLPFDDIATTLWMHEIAYTVREDEGILCDGFPRRVEEAKNLDRFLDFLGKNVRVALRWIP